VRHLQEKFEDNDGRDEPLFKMASLVVIVAALVEDIPDPSNRGT
jgi:hypothetical protein